MFGLWVGLFDGELLVDSMSSDVLVGVAGGCASPGVFRHCQPVRLGVAHLLNTEAFLRYAWIV